MTTRTARSLPSTVNLHLVAHCNMKCGYCYARFEDERRAPRLPTEDLITILRDVAAHGVGRVTFAGGEPTLHRDLALLLKTASDAGLVTSVVSNGARIDEAWLDLHGPHLRWLTLSIDSIDAGVTRELGRRTSLPTHQHLTQVQTIAELVHRWNARRPPARRLRLKLNITVTRRNAHEDPRPLIRAVRPEKVKLFQMLLVAGENDDAAHLVCEPAAFAAYADRARTLAAEGIEVVVEDNEAMDGSYAMVDPMGRFYQRVDGEYVRSRPIPDAGVMAAWADVGGFDAARFLGRGGHYDPGAVAAGNPPYLVAVEGIDGVGKSTTVAALAAALDAVVIHNPPVELAAARAEADRLPAPRRRAWYLAANRAAARRAEAARASGRPVVMDRSVASTLAFAAAEQGAAPAPWPEDVPRPDLLAVLTLDEAARRRRLNGRGDRLTSEEARLSDDAGFRARVEAAYLALGGRRIDADATVEQVVAAIRAALDEG